MITRNTRKTIIELKNMAFSLNEEAITPMEQNRQIGRIRKILLTALEYIEDLQNLAYIVDSLKYKDAEVIDLDKAEELEGVDDSEEVEFTKKELSTIYHAMKEVGENFPSGHENEKYLNTIISKLNKMLKEKE